MSWYSVGTISLQNGSATVSASGSQFISGAQVGEALYAPDGNLYEIQSITSATEIILATNYLGATVTGRSYSIVPTQSLVSSLANNVGSLITDFSTVKDNAGNGRFLDGTVNSPGLTFLNDQNNGIYRIGSDNWGMVAGGAKIVDVSSTGIDVTGTATMDGLTIPTGSKVAFDTDGLTYISEDVDDRLRFWVAGTEFIRMTNTTTDEIRLLPYGGTVSTPNLDVTGNVLVGKSSFTNAGQGTIIGGTASNHVALRSTRSAGTGTETALGFYVNGGSQIGSISTTTSATSYNTSSDYRLKEDWQPIANATETFMQLKPCNFAWKVDGTRVDGFLAHELQEVIPCAATGEKDAMKDEEYEVSPAMGDVYTAGSEAGFNEVSPEVVGGPAYYDIDGVQIRSEIISESAVHEAFDAVAEVIHSSDVAQPETLEEGQAWRETTAQVMATRSVPDMQGIDQAKVVPLLTAALQEAINKIEAMELRLSALEI